MEAWTTIPRWRVVEPPAIPLKTPELSGQWLRLLWNGVVITLASMGVFMLFARIGPLLRLADPTAAEVDIGALSLVLLAVVALAAFITVSRWLLGLLWPVMRNYQRNHFANNFKSLRKSHLNLTYQNWQGPLAWGGQRSSNISTTWKRQS